MTLAGAGDILFVIIWSLPLVVRYAMANHTAIELPSGVSKFNQADTVLFLGWNHQDAIYFRPSSPECVKNKSMPLCRHCLCVCVCTCACKHVWTSRNVFQNLYNDWRENTAPSSSWSFLWLSTLTLQPYSSNCRKIVFSEAEILISQKTLCTVKYFIVANLVNQHSHFFSFPIVQ